MTVITDDKIAELKDFIRTEKMKDNPESYLIAILHRAQNIFGYLDRQVLDIVATEMQIPTAKIWGVATFYHYFNLKPKGLHTVAVCLGTACYVKGSGEILDAIKNHLEIEVGETTEDKMFTLQEARCLGACGLAPVVMIDEKIYGGLTPEKAVALLNTYRKK